MTLEDQIVCLCTRQSFDEVHRERLLDMSDRRAVDWEAVHATAELHHVSPLVYLNLLKGGEDGLTIPRTAALRFKKSYMQNVLVKKKTNAVLKELLGLFARKGIEVMLVKGAALNISVYEQPWYTISYDVDLTMRSRQEEIPEADHLEIVEIMDALNHSRGEFQEHIEYDYYEHHDVTLNNLLPVDTDRLWHEARKIQVQGHDVFIMTPEDMLLAAAIQNCRKRFMHLKSLCDMAAIIQKHPDFDWSTFTSKARAYKANTIACTALLVLQLTLGNHVPDRIFYDLRVSSIRKSVVSRCARRLIQHFSLADLFLRSESSFFGREFSWPLLLTYASYRLDLIGPKLMEVYSSWRTPPPPTPPPVSWSPP